MVGRRLMAGRTSLTVYDGMIGMSETSSSTQRTWLRNTDHGRGADPENGANGVIWLRPAASWLEPLYKRDGKPSYTYNWLGLQRYTVAATQAREPGRRPSATSFATTAAGSGKGGTGTLFVNASRSPRVRSTAPNAGAFSADEGATWARTRARRCIEAYKVPFKFTGKIASVTIG